MLEQLASPITHLIESGSYLVIIFIMALESCDLPIPSEVIMPFAGFLVSVGKQNFWLAALSGAIGCTLGSLLNYWLGAISEKSWIRVWLSGWGRVVITSGELKQAEEWLRRYGAQITFFGRLLPIVRGYVSFPAGVARIPLMKFTIYTFVGSFIWCTILTYIGFKLGQHWQRIGPFFRQFDLIIAVAFIIGISWLVYLRVKHLRS